jgi:rRNA-processing protein FCF1
MSFYKVFISFYLIQIMAQVLLDTNFMITSVKEKIDFFDKLERLGFKILIPKQVINELKIIVASKKKLRIRRDAKLILKILEKKKGRFRRVDLAKYGKNTDNKIKGFGDKHRKIVIATLDKELKKKIQNPKLVIRERKKLEII